jgi:hypothetical protein
MVREGEPPTASCLVSRQDEVDGTLDGIERAKVTDFAIITKGPPT